ncbi:MAG: nucleoside monophosphate kinase [Patescibacteria group bacterium]|nr:nucleoside monophosphate kinase [Patescibacteria group bacterium]
MNILIFGAQGSGKGTQADLLSKKIKIPHITVGDIFRLIIKEESELGKTLASYLNKGRLAPNEITNRIVAERLKKIDVARGFILDGYPRNKIQADFLDIIREIDKVIEIRISDSEAIERIKDRRICYCGRTYHLKYNPPKQDGVCDDCGEKLYQRDDDKPKEIKERLNIYHKETEPIIEAYKKRGIVKTVEGERPIHEIHLEIMKFFRNNNIFK